LKIDDPECVSSGKSKPSKKPKKTRVGGPKVAMCLSYEGDRLLCLVYNACQWSEVTGVIEHSKNAVPITMMSEFLDWYALVTGRWLLLQAGTRQQALTHRVTWAKALQISA
jgi:hypothetical protein